MAGESRAVVFGLLPISRNGRFITGPTCLGCASTERLSRVIGSLQLPSNVEGHYLKFLFALFEFRPTAL
jgi:hypothetical protein